MLTKFESKSSRAKCVVFHPQRPWILVALHSSTIQLWDYRMGTLIDRFEGHDGPVRGVDFHKTQPLFASCGDDYSVRVWSLQTRKCLFTLNGHLDYVRTVFFHPELPWLLTSSDDQTIRIWNWQNRKEIACLTGHNHYVYCAQFHPTQDLIVSASLDQTVRVWDFSGLRKRHSAPSSSSPAFSFEEQMARANSMALSQQSGFSGTSASSHDMFGTDAIVKYVLEGHDRGLNWAEFHPTLPLIISAGDDRVVKLWRMSETKAWEVDTCRGHTANVICCTFHPFQDLILSVGEDKTIRVWDLHKRTPVQQFKRDPDRFWHISCHPTVNLFAAAHDEGVMVFKLERERPASTLSPQDNSLLYINREKAVIQCDLNTGIERPLVSLKKVALAPWTPFRSMSYNPADRSVLVVSKETASASGGTPNLSAQNTIGTYELVNLPKADTGAATDPQNSLRGTGDQALFISRNRFLVLNTATQSLEVRDLGNAITKTVKSPVTNTKDIVYGGAPGVVLILGSSSVALYSVQQKTVVAEANINGVKYASWSNDGNHLALLAKHGITIVDKNLETISFIHETIRIKSATWDVATSGVLVYTTLNHLKYALLNGDSGILRSLQNTMYVIKAQNESVACINRGGTVKVLKIDPTEYRFKRALVNNDFNEVLRIIKTSQLVGQSIIAYVQNKGYAEIALQFVQDPQTRFDLAIESGNIAVAHEQAKILNNAATWKILVEEALAQGNHDVVEDVYQRQREFDKLSFMYLVTNNTDRLSKMEQIAANRDDALGIFQTSIFARSIEPRITLLKNSGMAPLAYSLAKSNGMYDLANEILSEAGLEETDVRIPTHSVEEKTYPTAKKQTYASNWPVKPSPLSFFEQALLGNMESLSLEETAQFTDAQHKRAEKPGLFREKTLSKDVSAASGARAAVSAESDESEGEAEDWDIDLGGDVGQHGAADLIDINDEGEVQSEGVTIGTDEGVSEPSLWTRSSQVPVDHVAAGSFETAMQLLNRQAAVVEFAPLKERFLDVYKGCHLYLSGNEGLPPLQYFPRRNASKPLPLVPNASNISELIEHGQALVADTYKSMREKTVKVSLRKLENIVTHFRETLHAILLTATSNAEEAEAVKRSITTCRDYILAFSIEIERRRIQKAEPDNKKRELELAALFTKPQLSPQDRAYQLVTAMMSICSRKNFQLASVFASELLELEPENLPAGMERWLDDAKKIVVAAERAPLDPIEVEYDQFAEFAVCPATLTPIYGGAPSVTEPLTQAKYHADYKNTVCVITKVTNVGGVATGLRLFA